MTRVADIAEIAAEALVLGQPGKTKTKHTVAVKESADTLKINYNSF